MNDIPELLRSYGSSLAEVRELVPKLTEAIEKQEKKWLTTPQFFTAEDIKGLGLTTEAGESFSIDPDWILKITPTEEGEYTLSYIAPGNIEVAPEDVYVYEGKFYTSEQMEALEAETEITGISGRTEEQLIDQLAKPWLLSFEEAASLQEELDAIRAIKAAIPMTGISGRTEQQLIESLAGDMPVPERIRAEEELSGIWAAKTITELYPERDIIEVFEYIETDFDAFLTDIREIGKTQETVALLRILYPRISDAELNWIFAAGVLNMTQHEAVAYGTEDYTAFRRDVLDEGRTPESEAFVLRVHGFEAGTKEGNECLDKFFKYSFVENFVRGNWMPNFLKEYWQLGVAGIGSLEKSVAGVAAYFGWEGINETLMDWGLKTEKIAGAVEMGKENSPEWYAKHLTRMLPMIISIIAPSLATFGGAGAIVTAAGGGTFLRTIIGTIAAGASASVIEGSFEVGDVFNTAIAKGFTEQEAKDAAEQTFLMNIGLLSLTNTAQFAASFILPGSPTVRVLIKALGLAGSAASEGLEEGVQLAIARSSLGEKQTFDEEFWMNVKLGTAGGVAFSSIGVIYSQIQTKVMDRMTPAQKAKFNRDVSGGIDRGLSKGEAETKALDNFASTPSGETIITEAVQEQMAQEAAESKPKAAEAVKAIDPKKFQTRFEDLAKERAVEEIPVGELETFNTELFEVNAQIEGFEATIAESKLKKLLPVWNRMQRRKDQPPHLTLKEYRDLTGKRIVPETSLTPDKKHVYWMDALDSVVTEYGYKTTDELLEGLNDLGLASKSLEHLYHRRGYLQDAIADIEKRVVAVRAAREIAAREVPKPPLTEQLKQLYSEVDVEVKAAQAAIKGLRGDEAKIARETLKGLDRELKYIKNTMDSFAKRPDLPEATVLRSTIMAWARYKGLSKKTLTDIYHSIAGKRRLSVIPQEQLLKILDKVKAARPKTIRGRHVITPKTEKKIQTLKDTLIANKQLTEKSFAHLMEQLGLRTSMYESQFRFITETEGKALIRAMNDEAVLAGWSIKVEETLDRHPDIKKARDDLNARSIKEREVTFDDKPIRIGRGNELRSMRYYVLKLQKKLNAPIYDVWQKINMAHLALRQKQQILINRLEQSTPKFRDIANDDVALTRVEDYIASKHKMGPKAPADITAAEIKLANELERQLFGFRNDVRFARFTEAYAGHSGDIDAIARDIPDAPKAALRRAIDIFEGKGAEALRKFLDTQEWGVIRTGYDPRSIIKPKLHLYPPRPTTFARGHIQTRRGIEYTAEDRNILSRYSSYTKQMMGLTDLSPLIRAFDRVFTEHAHKLDNYRPVAGVLSRGLNEMKGYREDGGFIIHILERLYAQVASAVFWRPDLVLRNKFQNFAFNPDYHAGLFLHPGNRFLSAERRRWFEVFITQQKGIEQDYLLYSQKPLPGFGWLIKLSHKTSLYPWSDKSNRAEAYFVRMNRIDRALTQYEKDGDVNKLIANSGLREFEPRQQAEALELLALDRVDYGIEGMLAVSGKEAFARYNAQQLVNNVHFLYDRAQRAPAEMGASGKTLGNILVFTRSWGERLYLQSSKLGDPKVSMREKILAMRIIVGIIVAGLLAGEAYKKITGKSHNPYNPLNILTWTPGGLIVGVSEDISNVMYLITQAVQGDKGALGQLPGVLSGVADITLPFYKNLVQALDSLTDKKDIDVLVWRKIREMIDDEYEVRGGEEEVERTLLEKLQHALLAGKDKPATPQEKLSDLEEMLGQAIEEEDKPFSIEDPDIYDIKNLNTDMGRIIGDIDSGEITEKNGYSLLAMAWVGKEASESIWKTLPNTALYRINSDPKEGDTFEEYYRQWQERQKIKDPKQLAEFDDLYPKAYLGNISRRELDLLRQYHSLDKKEQDAFLEAHPELKLNPRDEWLEANPKENAKLALWGQAKILSLEAYNELKRLIKELDIPDDAIAEFTLPPEGSVENYFKYMELGEQFGYNSAEVRLLLAEDDALREWLGREPIDTPVKSLEISVKYRELDDEYDAYGDRDSPQYIEDDDQRAEARTKLLEDNPDFRDDRYRRDAYSLGFSDNLIDSYVEYYNLPAKGFRQERYLLEHPDFYQSMIDLKDIVPFDPDYKVPAVQYDEIYEKWEDLFESYESVTGTTTEREKAREKILADNPQFAFDRQRRKAYGIFLPEEQVDTYAEFYTSKTLVKPDDWKYDFWFEDDWFLLEHPEFYQAMVELYRTSDGKYGWKEFDNDGNLIRDFRKVPTRAVCQLYKTYLGIPAGTPRLDFRAKYPELEAWLVNVKGYKPIEDRGEAEAPETPWEEFEEVERFKELF